MAQYLNIVLVNSFNRWGGANVYLFVAQPLRYLLRVMPQDNCRETNNISNNKNLQEIPSTVDSQESAVLESLFEEYSHFMNNMGMMGGDHNNNNNNRPIDVKKTNDEEQSFFGCYTINALLGMEPKSLPQLSIISEENNGSLNPNETHSQQSAVEGPTLEQIFNNIEAESSSNTTNTLNVDGINTSEKPTTNSLTACNGNIKHLLLEDMRLRNFGSLNEMISAIRSSNVNQLGQLSGNQNNRMRLRDTQAGKRARSSNISDMFLCSKRFITTSIKDINYLDLMYSDESKTLLQHCITEFICNITKRATKNCPRRYKVPVIRESDIIDALNSAHLTNYSNVLSVQLAQLNKKEP